MTDFENRQEEITKEGVKLNFVNANSFSIKEYSENELIREPNFKIVETNSEKNLISIKLVDKFYFDVDKPPKVIIEHIGKYNFANGFPEWFSEDKLNEEILSKLGFNLSLHSLSFLDDLLEKFGLEPAILPPWEGFEDKLFPEDEPEVESE